MSPRKDGNDEEAVWVSAPLRSAHRRAFRLEGLASRTCPHPPCECDRRRKDAFCAQGAPPDFVRKYGPHSKQDTKAGRGEAHLRDTTREETADTATWLPATLDPDTCIVGWRGLPLQGHEDLQRGLVNRQPPAVVMGWAKSLLHPHVDTLIRSSGHPGVVAIA